LGGLRLWELFQKGNDGTKKSCLENTPNRIKYHK